MEDEMGMITMENKDFARACALFERNQDLVERGLIHEELSHLDPMEARLKVRRMVMSVCLSKPLGIPKEIEFELMKTPDWVKIIDLCLFMFDTRDAEPEDIKQTANAMLDEIAGLTRE